MQSADLYIIMFLLRRWIALKISLLLHQNMILIQQAVARYFSLTWNICWCSHMQCNPYCCYEVSYLLCLTISQKHFGAHTSLQGEDFEVLRLNWTTCCNQKSKSISSLQCLLISNLYQWEQPYRTVMDPSFPIYLAWKTYLVSLFIDKYIFLAKNFLLYLKEFSCCLTHYLYSWQDRT